MNRESTEPLAPPGTSAVKWPLLIGIFLLSAAILHLEILQTRIFSVLLWHHVTYLVVTFTLLGFAASGALLSLFPGLLDRSPAVFLATCSLLFAITTHGAFQYLGRSQLDTLELLQDRAQYLTVFVYYLYLVVPFLSGGLAVVRALRYATYEALGPRRGWFAFWDGVLWIALVILAWWVVVQYVPGVNELFQRLFHDWRDIPYEFARVVLPAG